MSLAGPPSIAVKLTWPEVTLAAHAGVMRQVHALGSHLADRHGYDGAGWDTHILGALGEMAFCKAFGLYWKPTVNTFKSPDVGATIEIRARHRHSHELILRPDDKFERTFVLVTGAPPILRVRGWINGSECQRDEWWAEHGNRPGAWFVAQDALHPPDDLNIEPIIASIIGERDVA